MGGAKAWLVAGLIVAGVVLAFVVAVWLTERGGPVRCDMPRDGSTFTPNCHAVPHEGF